MHIWQQANDLFVGAWIMSYVSDWGLFLAQLDPEVKAAFDVAYDNIYCFHAAQKKTQQLQVETMPVRAIL
jgi:hypothetical protein